MDIKQYTRKPFPVAAVQVSLQNIQEIAEWCRGTVEQVSTRMLGTETFLPAIKIQGQGENRGKEFTATLGCWVVELKGSYRVYKPQQFEATFDELEVEEASVEYIHDVVDGVLQNNIPMYELQSDGVTALPAD
jgi:hypothetical protein